MLYDLAGKRVWVAGERGMVGSAIVRRLEREGCVLLHSDRSTLDLCNQASVTAWMEANRPQAIFVAAARVGGIYANDTLSAEFLYENLMIEANIIHAAHGIGTEKLLFLGSSCIYPRDARSPLHEDVLLTGPLEHTNEWYAIAKIAGVKLCQAYRKQYGDDFISVMPPNLYGPKDNFHPENSHVPAALLRRFHEAKLSGASEVVVWGTGTPRREFLHVDDLADACIFLMQNYSNAQHINVGTGTDMTIAEFAEAIKRTVGYEGQLVFDTTRPDGTPRKVNDVSRLTELGWTAKIDLPQGLIQYYEYYRKNHA